MATPRQVSKYLSDEQIRQILNDNSSDSESEYRDTDSDNTEDHISKPLIRHLVMLKVHPVTKNQIQIQM